MSLNSAYCLPVPTLLADREAEVALAVSADYQPFNEEFSVANIRAAHTDMLAAQEDEILAEAALAAERRFHETICDARCIAQCTDMTGEPGKVTARQ